MAPIHLSLASPPRLSSLYSVPHLLEPRGNHAIRQKPCYLAPPSRHLRSRALVPKKVSLPKLCCNRRFSDATGVKDEESMRSFKMPDNSRVDANMSNDFERQLDELFVEIKQMLERGDKDDAVDLLLANYEVVKEQIDVGNKGIEQAATLDVVALGYLAAGEVKFVEHLLDMLMVMVKDINDDTPLLDSVLIHMGTMYSNLGKFSESMAVYNRSLEILGHTYGMKSPFAVLPLLGKAKVYALMGKFTNAVEVHKEVINILETSKGRESQELVVPLFALGNLHIDQGLDAEPYFKRILSIYKNALGETDGRVGMARCSLARALCAKGNIQEAIQEYERGLQVIEDSNYMGYDDLQMMRVDLAELFHVAGRIQEGRELLEESLLIAERSKGSGHPSSIKYLLNLATSYSYSKNYVEAERLLRFIVQLMSKKIDPIAQDITVPMLQLAVVLYNLGRDKEAENIAIQVLNSREEAFGKHSLPVGEALDCLTSIQTRLGRDCSKLLEQLRRILEIQERELGYDSEDVMETLKKILFMLDKMGKKDEKFKFQRRLSVLRSKHKHSIPS